MKWIIERFEEDFAVIECGKLCFNVPKTALPPDASEGDVFNIAINTEETKNRENEMKSRLKKLFGE